MPSSRATLRNRSALTAHSLDQKRSAVGRQAGVSVRHEDLRMVKTPDTSTTPEVLLTINPSHQRLGRVQLGATRAVSPSYPDTQIGNGYRSDAALGTPARRVLGLQSTAMVINRRCLIPPSQ